MEMVNVYSTRGELDAEVIKSILNSKGIPVMIKGRIQGGSPDGLNWNPNFGKVEVLVRPVDAERALEILSSARIDLDLPDLEYEEDE
jgi:hypothetical protein